MAQGHNPLSVGKSCLYFPVSHNKHLAQGHFLIDARTANGAGNFPGKHIYFGPKGKDFPDWKAVLNYMKPLA